MPIPVQGFPLGSYEQEHPFLQQLTKSIGLGQSMMKFPEQLKQERLANALKQIELQNAPEKQQLGLDLLRAQIEQKKQLAQMPGGLKNITGPAASALSLKFVEDQYGKDSEVYKLAKQKWDAEENAAKIRGLGVGGREQQLFESTVSRDNPNLTSEQKIEAGNRMKQGYNTLEDGTPINITQDARDSMDRIVKQKTTAQGLNQQRYANTLETAINSAEQNAPGAVKFSGLMSTLGLPLAKMKAQFGTSNPSYQAYINFTRTDVPTMAGEYMRELGVNASDEQKRMYKEVVNPIAWDTDFNTAYARWNYFKELARKIGVSVSKSPSQIQQENIRREENKLVNKVGENVEGESKRIRVKRLSDKQTGTILEKDFDESKYEKIK